MSEQSAIHLNQDLRKIVPARHVDDDSTPVRLGDITPLGQFCVSPINSTEVQHLALLKKGDCATVSGLTSGNSPEQLAVRMRLLELGFAAGEKVRVVAESFPRRDPMAVRLGNTTFALRRYEAAMIQIVRSELNAA